MTTTFAQPTPFTFGAFTTPTLGYGASPFGWTPATPGVQGQAIPSVGDVKASVTQASQQVSPVAQQTIPVNGAFTQIPFAHTQGLWNNTLSPFFGVPTGVSQIANSPVANVPFVNGSVFPNTNTIGAGIPQFGGQFAGLCGQFCNTPNTFGQPVNTFGQPVNTFGQPINTFGFGGLNTFGLGGLNTFGQPVNTFGFGGLNTFGQPFNTFGFGGLNTFGQPVNTFGFGGLNTFGQPLNTTGFGGLNTFGQPLNTTGFGGQNTFGQPVNTFGFGGQNTIGQPLNTFGQQINGLGFPYNAINSNVISGLPTTIPAVAPFNNTIPGLTGGIGAGAMQPTDLLNLFNLFSQHLAYSQGVSPFLSGMNATQWNFPGISNVATPWNHFSTPTTTPWANAWPMNYTSMVPGFSPFAVAPSFQSVPFGVPAGIPNVNGAPQNGATQQNIGINREAA